MREIKFRAWFEGEMHFDVGVTPCTVIFYEDLGLKMCAPVVDAVIGSECDGLFVMQFTGIKDKNGKDIFEGDVVEYFSLHSDRHMLYPSQKTTGIIVYYQDRCQFLPQEIEENHKGGNYITPWDFLDEIVVIGNIHENPDIING